MSGFLTSLLGRFFGRDHPLMYLKQRSDQNGGLSATRRLVESVALKDSKPSPLGWQATSLAMLTVILWGGNPVAVKYCLPALPPIAIAAVRFAMAAAFMVFWCAATRESLWPRKGQWGVVTIAGVLLYVQIGAFNLGVAWTSSSHCTLLINTFIFWVVLIEHFITRSDRLTSRKSIGLVLAAFGAMLVIVSANRPDASAGGDPASLWGDAMTLFSAMVLGVKIVYTKHAVRTMSPGSLILWHDVVGVVLFMSTSALTEQVSWDRIDGPAIGGLIYQGVFVAGVCFAVQAVLLRRHSASQISVFSFATPLCGVTLAVLFRGDPITIWILAAGVLVAAGIYLVNTAPSKSSPQKTQKSEIDIA